MRRSPKLPKKGIPRRSVGCHAFSLIEVVIALGICVFALFPVMGLLATGLHLEHDTKRQMQAADLATLLVTERRDAPTNALAYAALPSLNQAYPSSPVTTWVDFAGSSTTFANSAFRLSYQVGTNSVNSNVGMIHVLLTWPAGADLSLARGRYEVTTQVLMPQ